MSVVPTGVRGSHTSTRSIANATRATTVTTGTLCAPAFVMRHLLCLASITLLGCGRHGIDDHPDGGGSGVTDAGPDASCGSTHLDLTYVAPNLLFVMDRSCSMKKDLDGTQTTKWQAAVAAITHVISSYTTFVQWGVTLFPDTTGDSCSQDAIPIPLGATNGDAITTLLTDALDPNNALYPSGPCVTNIDTGLEQAATDPGLADTSRKSYLMLVTDGSQSKCEVGGGNAGSETAVTNLLAAGVPTFVVGFGSEVDVAELSKLANLGGEALTGPTPYYSADTADEIDMALQSIANKVASCSYKVDPAPLDLNLTYVVFDGTELVPRDTGHSDGWDYDNASEMLTLYGDYCTRVEDLQVSGIDVTYGCPPAL